MRVRGVDAFLKTEAMPVLGKEKPGAVRSGHRAKERSDGAYSRHENSCNRKLRIKKRKVVSPGGK
jgi:hypothetical protein